MGTQGIFDRNRWLTWRSLIAPLLVADAIWLVIELFPSLPQQAGGTISDLFRRSVLTFNPMGWRPNHWAVAFGLTAMTGMVIQYAPGIWKEIRKPSRKRRKPTAMPAKRRRGGRREDLDGTTKMLMDIRRRRG